MFIDLFIYKYLIYLLLVFIIMKFKNIVENLLIEASKTDTLVKKLGVNEYNAEALAKIAGPLSIFFAYKILEKLIKF